MGGMCGKRRLERALKGCACSKEGDWRNMPHLTPSFLAGGWAMSSPATVGASTCSSGVSSATGMSGTPISRSCNQCDASVTRSGTSAAAS